MVKVLLYCFISVLFDSKLYKIVPVYFFIISYFQRIRKFSYIKAWNSYQLGKLTSIQYYYLINSLYSDSKLCFSLSIDWLSYEITFFTPGNSLCSEIYLVSYWYSHSSFLLISHSSLAFPFSLSQSICVCIFKVNFVEAVIVGIAFFFNPF